MRSLHVGAALSLLLAGALHGQVAQEKVDLGVIQKIREEGLSRSHIEEYVGYLTDVIGPRVTGSSGIKRAHEWSAQQLRDIGLSNVVIEPWGEFGKGWDLLSYAANITTPYPRPLMAYPQAWSGGTKGTIEGPVVLLEASTPQELRQKYAGKLKHAFVLAAPAREVDPEFTARTRRYSVDELMPKVQLPEDRNAAAAAAATPPAGRPQMTDAQRAAMVQRAALNATLDSLLRAENAVLLQQSNWQYNMFLLGARGSRDPKDPPSPPALVVSQEEYGQLYRNAKRGVAQRIQANVQVRYLTDDTKAYNTLADLRGSDKADEFVMLGGHIDSWHGGTGATDNASGTAVMMEAMRILKTLGLQPRRTVRIGLWSGEEQGLLGSRGWVQNHKELHPKISAYVNFDNGTGRIRGIWDQSNEKAIPVFEQILFPFRDLGVVAVRHGNTGGTDHLSFDAAGVPGFNFIQDPIEYGFRTHHSNIDVYDQLVIDDLKQAAVVVAATVWQLAIRDEMMPRKAPATN